MGPREVVEVKFDPKVTSYEKIAKTVRAKGSGWSVHPLDDAQCKSAGDIWGRDVAKVSGKLRADKDPKYYLGRTELRHVPMTEAQAVRINARLRNGVSVELLSPRQRELLADVRAHPKAGWPVVIDKGLAAWDAVEAVRRRVKKS